MVNCCYTAYFWVRNLLETFEKWTPGHVVSPNANMLGRQILRHGDQSNILYFTVCTCIMKDLCSDSHILVFSGNNPNLKHLLRTIPFQKLYIKPFSLSQKRFFFSSLRKQEQHFPHRHDTFSQNLH